MGRKGQPKMSKALAKEKIVKVVTTRKEFRHAIKYRGLSVVEMYSKTWGPCQCIFPKLQGLYKDYMDRPIHLVTAEVDEITELVEYHGKSMPTFVLYKRAQILDTIEGVNAPALERAIQDNAPTKDELATTQDEPDSEDEATAETTTGKTRRPSLATGLGRRRSVVK